MEVTFKYEFKNEDIVYFAYTFPWSYRENKVILCYNDNNYESNYLISTKKNLQMTKLFTSIEKY